MHLVRVTAPTELPVTLTEIKKQLEITADTEDTYLSAILTAATRDCEEWTGLRFLTQTWLWYLDKWERNANNELVLPVAPVSALSIEYKEATAGTLTAWSSSEYETEGIRQTNYRPGRIKPGPDYTWPDLYDGVYERVQITMTCGFGSVTAVPQEIKQAIMMLAAYMYEHREDVYAGGGPVQKLPKASEFFLRNYRVQNFS